MSYRLRPALALIPAGIAVLSLSALLPALANDPPASQTSPKLTNITPASLPKPYASASANNGPKIVPKPEGASLKLPPGFTAEVFAEGFDNVRSLAVAPNGDVFAVEPGPGRVTVLRDTKGAGKADVQEVFVEGLRQAFGIAFWKGSLYLAKADAVMKFDYKDGQTKASGEPKMLCDLPAGKGHWTRGLAFSPKNGKMYVSVGSEADFAADGVPGRAVIMEYNDDGTGGRVYADGLRNAVGMDFQPGTGVLWSAVNERDGLGDDLPPDYVTSVKEGAFYGWPYYYSGANLDPRSKEMPELKRRTVVPDVMVTAHTAALGIAFYTGKQFPKEYQGSAFVALHGSGNRTKRVGYSIVRIPFKNGKPVGGFEDFLTGWMMGEDDNRVWGRPVSVAVAKDGALLVVDDGANKIWRVSYKK